MSTPTQSDDNPDNDVSVILAVAYLPNPPMTLEEKREELTAAHRLIKAKYDARIPFFYEGFVPRCGTAT